MNATRSGAEIYGRRRGSGPRAVVAFEHHLRLDGTGYRTGHGSSRTSPDPLRIAECTMLRSSESISTRFHGGILAVLSQRWNAFDQNLIRRFGNFSESPVRPS